MDGQLRDGSEEGEWTAGVCGDSWRGTFVGCLSCIGCLHSVFFVSVDLVSAALLDLRTVFVNCVWHCDCITIAAFWSSI